MTNNTETGTKYDGDKVPAIYSYLVGRGVCIGQVKEAKLISALIEALGTSTNSLNPPKIISTLYTHLLLTQHLLPEDVVKCCQFGANKYGYHNYRKGMDWSRLISAYIRHDIRMQEYAEEIDKESGLPHVAHKASNLQMLAEFIGLGLGTNDIQELFEDDRIEQREELSGQIETSNTDSYNEAL